MAQDLSLSEILDLKTTVASLRSLTTRESPGIVTVITADQIRSAGVNDFDDILKLVPGYQFGTDINGFSGLISRGMWTYEGKVLINIDGLLLNENAFGGAYMKVRVPVDQIDRIEIVRGPGSAIYGGFAGLNVINIHTKKGKDLKGGEFVASSGRTKRNYGTNYLSAIYGASEKNLDATVGTYVARANYSDKIFRDMNNKEVDLTNGARINPEYINTGFTYKGLDVRLLHERYIYTSVSGIGYVTKAEGYNLMENQQIGIKKTFNLTKKFKLTPEYIRGEQRPYFAMDVSRDSLQETSNRIHLLRDTAKVLLEFDASENFNVMVGLEKYWDFFEKSNYWTFKDPPTVDPAGVPANSILKNTNLGFFTQLMFMNYLGNFTLGVRQDKPDQYDATVVPRFAYTKVINDFHFKLLYAKSYRAPNLASINLNSEVKPELITTSEVEFGYKLSESQFINFNVYRSQIEEPLAYFYDLIDQSNNYLNYEKLANQGYELEYRFVNPMLDALANFSTYKATEINAEPLKPSLKNEMIYGASANLANLKVSLKPLKGVVVTPSVNYASKKVSVDYDENDTVDGRSDRELDAVTKYNLYLHTQDLVFKGLSFGIGANNMTDTTEYLVQPYVYSGDHAPLPISGRHMYAKLGYEAEF